MKRKIVQHGSSSLTITLPKKWVDKYKLKKGDEVNVDDSSATVMVSTEKETALSKKEFHAQTSGVFTKNNLSHLYQLGYDEIEIKFDDPHTLDEIKERVPNLIGFEIIDQKENKVYIKSITNTLESDFDLLLRKSFQITNELAKDTLTALEKSNFSRLTELKNMELLNNKFTDVCLRILNKRGYKHDKKVMQIYEVVKNVERIADQFKYIGNIFQNHNKKIDKELLISFKEAINYYLDFYQMFYKFDPKLKEKIYLHRKKMIKKYLSQLEKSKGNDSLFLHYIISLVEKTYEGAGAYFALVL
jgi:phosphate uptake regulator